MSVIVFLWLINKFTNYLQSYDKQVLLFQIWTASLFTLGCIKVHVPPKYLISLSHKRNKEMYLSSTFETEYYFILFICFLLYLTIIPRARMGSESIAHEAEGRMGY